MPPPMPVNRPMLMSSNAWFAGRDMAGHLELRHNLRHIPPVYFRW
jgi:hypothetical protein